MCHVDTAPRRARTTQRPRERVVAPVVASPPERAHRAPTPFIPHTAEVDEEEEETDPPRGVAEPEPQSPIHYDQPPAAVRGDITAIRRMGPANRSAYGPPGPKRLTPLRNPLPPPPKDLYEMSPYKSLLTLPQTTALLTKTYGNTVTVAPLGSNGTVKRNKSIFRAFSRKDKKKQPQPELQNPVFIPVFVPASPQPQQQQPSNQPQQHSVQRSSTQIRQSEPLNRPRFQSHERPFAGAGPNDIVTPVTPEPTGGTYQPQDDLSSVSSEALSLPIPPHPTNPPTIKFDQSRSYTQFMNHSPHRVVWNDGFTYPTALHLHEALKFLDHRRDIAELIRRCGSVHEVYPLTAKYSEFQRPDWATQFLPLVNIFLFYI